MSDAVSWSCPTVGVGCAEHEMGGGDGVWAVGSHDGEHCDDVGCVTHKVYTRMPNTLEIKFRPDTPRVLLSTSVQHSMPGYHELLFSSTALTIRVKCFNCNLTFVETKGTLKHQQRTSNPYDWSVDDRHVTLRIRLVEEDRRLANISGAFSVFVNERPVYYRCRGNAVSENPCKGGKLASLFRVKGVQPSYVRPPRQRGERPKRAQSQRDRRQKAALAVLHVLPTLYCDEKIELQPTPEDMLWWRLEQVLQTLREFEQSHLPLLPEL